MSAKDKDHIQLRRATDATESQLQELKEPDEPKREAGRAYDPMRKDLADQEFRGWGAGLPTE